MLTYEHRVDLGAVDQRWIALLEEAWQVAPELAATRRARVCATLARALTFADGERSALLGKEAVALARGAGDPATLAFALTYRLMSFTGSDDAEADDSLALATEIVALAEQTGDNVYRMQGHDRRALALIERGDLAGATAEIATMCRIGAQRRYPHSEWRMLAWDSMRAILQGRFAEAEQQLPVALAIGERSGMPGAAQHYAIQLSALRRDQGRYGEIVGAIEGMVAQFPLAVWRAALAQAYVDLDRLEEARREFDLLAAHDFADLPHDLLRLCTLALLAYTCAALDDRPRAALLYDLLAPYDKRIVAVTLAASACNGCASRELGLLATTLGRWEAAAAHFGDAHAMNGAMGARPFVARVQFEQARLRFAEHDARAERPSPAPDWRAAAETLLAQARATAAELGMARLLTEIDRLDERRRAEFAIGAPAALRETPAPDHLTAREMDVLRLLAAGASNKAIAGSLFLSVATVRGHTISIYGKIGSTGRAAAAAYALRHGITPPDALN